MRIAMLLIFCTLFGAVAFAQAERGASTKKRVSVSAGRDLTLERDALAQRRKIEAVLPTLAKQKLHSVSQAFLRRLLRDKKTVDLSELLKQEMGRQFTGLSPQQSNILTFYVLTGIVRLLPPHADESDGGSERDSISEMNETDMLMLQQLMEKKNQLETMISNIMKAGFEGGQSAIQSLKAS